MVKKNFLKSSLIVALVVVMLVTALAVISTKTLATNDNGWTARAHAQTFGWLDEVTNIPVVAELPKVVNATDALTNAVIGTTGKSKRLEALDINTPEGVTLEYRAHIQSFGWQEWKTADSNLIAKDAKNLDNSAVGTMGLQKRLEALQIAVSGLTNYDLYYRTQSQTFGWGDWVKALDAKAETNPTKETANKDYAGTMDQSKRLEAVEMVLVLNEQGKAALAAKKADLKAELDALYNDGNGSKEGYLPEEAYNTAVSAMDNALTETELQDALDGAKEALMANVHTVNFIDTKFANNKSFKTDAEGKFSAENAPKLKDSEGKYRLLGWTKDQKTNKLVNFEEEVLEDNINLYSVWVLNAKATVNLHYDGEKNQDGTEKVVKIDKYLAGDILDLTSGDFALNATGPVNVPGTTYTQTGWYTVEGEVSTGKLTTYQIPEATEVTDSEDTETTEPETVVVDLHPTWDIKVSSVTAMNNNSIKQVMDSLKTLQQDQKQECAEIKINSEVNLSTELTIPEGVKVTFENKVTVGDGASLSGAEESIIIGENATVVKTLSNKTNAAKTTTGLNDSLNNELYDEVQLTGNISDLNADIKIAEDTVAKLDLNGKTLSLTSGKTFKNEGELTIVSTDTSSSGALTNATNSTDAVITNGEGATLTIVSGKIENKSTSDTTAKGAVVKNEKGGTLNINGGTIEASGQNGRMPTVLNEGTANITDGTFTRSANSDTHGQGYYVIVNHATMTITGGTFKAEKSSTANATSALIENGYTSATAAIDNADATLTITGGTFNGGRYLVASDYAGVTTVKGGKYKAKEISTDYTANNTTNGTRAIFKVVGEMKLDFSEATIGEDGNSSIDLGTKNSSKTKLVLVGDQYLTPAASKTTVGAKGKLEVLPFKNGLVKYGDSELTETDVKNLIVVEKGSTGTKEKVQSDITIHVGGKGIDPKNAGKELLTLLKNCIAPKETVSDLSKDKNKVTIILDGNVEIESVDPEQIKNNYKLTTEDSTLDLNGHNLTINALADFKKDIKVVDETKKGKITLNSAKTGNIALDIFAEGNWKVSDEKLAEIANAELGGE